jgi:hypothetical protein
MSITKPFASENPEVNELVNWIIRNFSPKGDASKAFLREVGTGTSKIRDGQQGDREIRFRKYEDSEGKFVQPIIKHDGISYPLLFAEANRHIELGIKPVFSTYDAEPARGSESNIHGGLLSLATGQTLGPATPANDVTVTKGTGKVLIVINAGSDLSGEFTVTGTSVDRNTGVTTPADTDTITVDSTTTDDSDTDGNGNTRHAFTGAYITSKWFVGTVVLSTSTLNLSDIDVYHVSFEQFGDTSRIRLKTFDANIFTTNVAAEFDAYIYSLVVIGDKCNVVREASLNVGTNGETAIANKYWRLRRGLIDKDLDGNKDGIWVDIHYSNSPAYVEDVTLKVWAKQMQILEGKEV